MVGGKNAVAIGEQKIGRIAGPHAVVATERHAEAIVRMADPVKRIGRRARELAHQAWCVIDGTVVGNDDFKLAIHAALVGQRHERSLEMRRTLIRREYHRDFELDRHENFRWQYWRGSVVENRLRGQDEPPLEIRKTKAVLEHEGSFYP